MSDSGLYPIQSWLWSELDDLGIDGVIYGRHILDLLTNSKHTIDHRLEEKEQSIFSKIAPGGRKRKYKYSRRCNSFSVYEEILWKKEVAVSCLLSATERKAKAEEMQANIQQVIDELYKRLALLHLASDPENANSDSNNNPSNGGDENVDAPEKKSGHKENYEDAFPSLDGSTHSPVPNKMSDSVWNKTEKQMEPKSGRDSDNSLIEAKLSNPSPHQKSQPPHYRDNSARKNQLSPSVRSSSKGNSTKDRVKKPHMYPLCPRNLNRHYKSFRKPKPSADYASSKGSRVTQQRQKRPPRPRYPPSRFQSRFRKNDNQKKKFAEKWNPQRTRYDDTKNAPKKPLYSKKGKVVKRLAEAAEESQIQQDYSYLPSWMETVLSDPSAPYVWGTCDGFGFPNLCKDDDEQAEDEPKEMPFSSQWYRDLDSGLLTFQPRTSSSDRAASSSSNSSSSRSSSSLFGEEVDLVKELAQPTSAAPESWMWCPSPSLWEDDESGVSSVSRLQSVYKRELMSFGAENHADDISGRMWEEYKTIFQDLQEIGAQTEQESSDDEKTSHIWPPKEDIKGENRPVVAEDFGIEFWTGSAEREFDRWSETTPSTNATHKSCFDSVTMLSHMGGRAVQQLPSAESNIWRYSPAQAWPRMDGMQKKKKFANRDEELARVMKNGSFGYFCESKSDAWDVTPQKERQLASLWGKGDLNGSAVAVEMDAPKEAREEQMMESLVEALFSGMGFDHLLDPDEIPEPNFGRKKHPWLNPSPSFNPGEFATSLSFDFRSLFMGAPIENVQSPDDNPWRPRWDIDELLLHSGFTPFTQFGTLDDLFLSLASTEDLDHQHGGLGGAAHKNGTVLDSVTEHEAWKTSLRIGNTWQTISGIRPVNVIYSENRPGTGYVEGLPLSATTHFRPISSTLNCEVDGTTGYGTSPITDHTLHTTKQPGVYEQGHTDQMTVPVIDTIESGQTTVSNPFEEPNFHINFSKLVQDKSMQTSFETVTRRDIPSCQQFVLPRPPETNSR